MGRIIGIDLGTTHSAACVFDDREGKFVMIPNRQGATRTPSVVAFKGGEVLVGVDARARLAMDPDNAVAEIKRHMGEPFRDDNYRPRFDNEGKPVPYTVKVAGKERTPQEISAYILRELKRASEEYLGESVEGAVITVPAYFTGGPRRATHEAGTLAGLDVKCLINETTAAVIAFGLATGGDMEEEESEPRKVLVYDLGGSAFDVSVAEITDGNVEVLAIGGDHFLGGIDFDKSIIDWVLARVRADHGVDLRDTSGLDAKLANAYKKAHSRVCETAEKTKIALGTQNSASIDLPFLFPADGEWVSLEYELSRSDFLMRIAPQLKGTLETVDETLASVDLEKEDIDEVLLVGGSTRIPKIREMLEEHFGKPPRRDINPEECVAIGAAMQALQYVALPYEVQEQVEQLGEMGRVRDITGHSLGVREGQDNMHVLIPRNTEIPVTAAGVFHTTADYQTVFKVAVYQGEEQLASNNELLTEFDLPDLPPLPSGRVKIEIAFELDINGVLAVRATNLMTGQECRITTNYGGKTEVCPGELEKLDGAGGRHRDASASGPAIPAAMQKSWRRAQDLLPTLRGADRVKLDAAMKEYLAALSADPGAIEDKGNVLLDALFDVILSDGDAPRLGTTMPAGRMDSIHFSVTAPTVIDPGTSCVLDVWAHLARQREEVVRRAREATVESEIRIRSKGPVRVARGTVLSVRLGIEGLRIEDPEDAILWDGDIGNATFLVEVPADAKPGRHAGVGTIYADGLRIARLYFTLLVEDRSGPVDQVPSRLEQHRQAFASYASADRDHVLARVQGIQKADPDLGVFLDVLSLRSGQDWQQELQRQILASDVFYLFWSAAAAASTWVEREWRYALKTGGRDFIDPVPLVDPAKVPPPPELAKLHFNDWVLYYARGE